MIRVAAFSLAGLKAGRWDDYALELARLFKKLKPELAVLPAHSSLLLCQSTGRLDEERDFAGKFRLFTQKAGERNREYLQLHSELARTGKLYLVAGTTIEEERGQLYHTAYCFGPDGKRLAQQRQTHLSREERAFGLSRGEELPLFNLGGLQAGLIVGNDSRHPEVGRILALQGADLVIHAGALSSGRESRLQPAGIWAQVQQNQFWAVEAQLKGSIGERSFGAQCAVIGPCEITPGSTGYLNRESEEKPFASAELAEEKRLQIKKDYPLLKLLRPQAYRGRLPQLYR